METKITLPKELEECMLQVDEAKARLVAKIRKAVEKYGIVTEDKTRILRLGRPLNITGGDEVNSIVIYSNAPKEFMLELLDKNYENLYDEPYMFPVSTRPITINKITTEVGRTTHEYQIETIIRLYICLYKKGMID